MPLLFRLFTEIGIVSQLSGAMLEARLPEGMTGAQFGVLNHLVRGGDGRTPLDIARAFQVAKTTMSHTLSGLVKQGLVEMRPNPDDGRSKCVWLTSAGRQRREAAIGIVAQSYSKLAEQLSTAKVAMLAEELGELRMILDANRVPFKG